MPLHGYPSRWSTSASQLALLMCLDFECAPVAQWVLPFLASMSLSGAEFPSQKGEV